MCVTSTLPGTLHNPLILRNYKTSVVRDGRVPQTWRPPPYESDLCGPGASLRSDEARSRERTRSPKPRHE